MAKNQNIQPQRIRRMGVHKYFSKAFLAVAMTLIIILNLQPAVGQNMTGNVTNSDSEANFDSTLTFDDGDGTSPPDIGTGSPTVSSAIPVPIEQTTFGPTSVPTFSATTLAPTFRATARPTNRPTLSTAAPTRNPTPSPTTRRPTLDPTVAATTSAPTAAPVVTTSSPTVNLATNPPTARATTLAPTTVVTTLAPTALATTLAPTFMPSMGPSGIVPTSLAPSVAPTTAEPTLVPTGETTPEATTSTPTAGGGTATDTPTTLSGTEVSGTVFNLVMTLVGMNQVMSIDAETDWATVTEDHTKEYFRQNSNLEITSVETTVTLLEQDLITVRDRQRQLIRSGSNNDPTLRRLQTASIRVKYSQEISFRTNDPDRDTLDAVVLSPFSTPADLEAYVEMLKETNSEFEDVVQAQDVQEGEEGGGGTEVPIVKPPESDGGGLSTGAIIGIVVGCVGAVLLVGGVGYYVSQRGDDGGYVTTGKTPPSQLDVGQGYDEVSTLAEPNTIRQSAVSNTLSGESIQGGGYGDQSVATVDYDYSKAYGGGGDTSVSSAGGTFGSQTHTHAAGGAATLGGATGASGGPLDPSYAESGSQFRGQNANVREELIDIYAPPGKLGVVIDTPDDGAPVVHAVKDSSVIADKLQVGDKLVAVDDEDVRSMTAIKVSKLISRKSANPSRKLSIIRTVVVDE